MTDQLTAGLMALVLSFSLLSGCSSSDAGSASTAHPAGVQPSFTFQSSYDLSSQSPDSPPSTQAEALPSPDFDTPVQLPQLPSYTGDAYIAVNGNIPYFDPTGLSSVSFEYYSPRDPLGRCGTAYACVGPDSLPTEERGSIGQVKPTGWHTVKYDCVDGKYLYNRCHLIGYQLTGENANEDNLITGTRSLNIDGMLPFENLVADYIKETGNHVVYRVTPIFEEDNLLANGVLMEGYSLEDEGAGICYCVYAYNAQPGVEIDYSTGESRASSPSCLQVSLQVQADSLEQKQIDYILNTNSKKFHIPTCSSVEQMNEQNKQAYTGSREDLIAQGYSPCGRCHP